MLLMLEEADRLYFALAELAQAEMQPPIAALNSLIIAQGNMMFLDRAFAVMQEFETVFNTKPNAQTYYALLGAIANSRTPRVENMLHIMSDMDDAGYTPDGGCFSLLLETMMKCRDTEGATSILEHLRSSSVSTITHRARTITSTSTSTDNSNTSTSVSISASASTSKSSVEEGVAAGSESLSGLGSESEYEEYEEEVVDVSHWPSAHTLRQLAIYYTKRGDVKQCEVVLQMMREKCGTKVLPLFFTQRLEKLAQLGVVVGDEEEE
jgi:hypothetical protein